MIYMMGGSGAPNFGDELMLLNWLRWTQERHRAAGGGDNRFSVVVDNNDAEVSKRQFGERFPHARFMSAFKRVRHPDKSTDFMANLRFGSQFFSGGHYRKHPQLAAAIAQLERASVLHIYGGGYINTLFATAGALLLGLAADAQRTFGMRVVATGLGLTPLAFDDDGIKKELVDVISRFELLEVRDSFSFQQIRKHAGALPNLLMGHDDSLLYPPRRDAARCGHRKLHLSGFPANNIFERAPVLDAVRRNLARFDEIVYWECAASTEVPVVESVRAHFKDVRITGVDELLFDGLPVEPGDYMLTMRFHPHLMAARLGCSGQFWALSKYYEHKHGSVVQLGSRFALFDPEVAEFESTDQPIVWREPGHNLLKSILADRIHGTAAA